MREMVLDRCEICARSAAREGFARSKSARPGAGAAVAQAVEHQA